VYLSENTLRLRSKLEKEWYKTLEYIVREGFWIFKLNTVGTRTKCHPSEHLTSTDRLCPFIIHTRTIICYYVITEILIKESFNHQLLCSNFRT